MINNTYNFGVDGNSLSHFINDVDASNTANGKPIYYLVNQHHLEIDASTFEEIGYLGLANSTGISVKNLNLRDNAQGLLFAYTANSIIKSVNLTNNWNGIHIRSSSNVSVIENNANNNFDYAIALRSCSNCTVAGNNANNNSWGGISLGASRNCMVVENNASNNYYNIHLVESANNLVHKNNAYPRNNGYSLVLYRSNNNTIYHNNFANSFLDLAVKSSNALDNGSEGNDWSDYNGTDTNHDGIGDTPYMVGENNVDNYPLMGRFSDFTVTLRGKTYKISVISSSDISQFQFSLDDEEISVMVTGENETMGFSRIGVPKAFLQELQSGELAVLINGEPPLLKQEWTAGMHTYFYFSYDSNACELITGRWLIIAASVLLITFVVVFWVLKKHRGDPVE